MSSQSLYVIELNDDKYYVGLSEDPLQTINKHITGHGNEWTKKYGVLYIAEIFEDCDQEGLEEYVLLCMKNFGIDNVRGYPYEDVVLSRETINQIRKCYKCGNYGHIARNCNAQDSNQQNINNNTQNNYYHEESNNYHDVDNNSDNNSYDNSEDINDKEEYDDIVDEIENRYDI